MSNKKGFTMVELLVVLIIVAILAAVATPIYLANTRRARVSEAIATMSLIRQAQRDYVINHPGAYFDITPADTIGEIQNALPTSVAAGAPTPDYAGVVVDAGVAQYFSNGAFEVDAGATAWTAGNTNLNTNAPTDFLIKAIGANSRNCTTGTGGISTNCAIHQADVATYEVEMDNSGRIFVCYGTCDTAGNWSAY